MTNENWKEIDFWRTSSRGPMGCDAVY